MSNNLPVPIDGLVDLNLEPDTSDPLVPGTPYEIMRNSPAMLSVFSYREREVYIRKYGFVLLTNEVLTELSTFLSDKKTLDVCAGTGSLCYHLALRGVDISACDIGGEHFHNYGMRSVWKRDHEVDCFTLLPGKYEAVVLSWPQYNTSFAAKVLNAMSVGQFLIYQGEGHGGCTGDDEFFEILESDEWEVLDELTKRLNDHHVKFQGIYDRWGVYRKKAVVPKQLGYTPVNEP